MEIQPEIEATIVVVEIEKICSGWNLYENHFGRIKPQQLLRNLKILTQCKFDEYLIEAIDEALSSLGAPVKNTVYFQLENSFNMPKNEIPKQIDEFTDIMHKIFGLGASRLEIKFMKNLHSKIKDHNELTEYKWSLSKWIVAEGSFKEYVHSAGKNYCNLQ